MVIQSESQNKKAWWQPSLIIFARISTWIIVPLLAALFLGKYLDGKFNTKPLIFIGMTVIAFLITCFGVVKVIKKFIRDTEKDSRDRKNNPTSTNAQ